MPEEFGESSEISVNSLTNGINNKEYIQKILKLDHFINNQSLQASFVSNRTNNSTKNDSKFDFKFKNCYKSLSLSDKSTKKTSKNLEYNFSDIFFKFVKRGFGIAEIIGSSGSGKTAICLHISQKIYGTVLYLDTSGSFDPRRAPKRKSFLHIRLYTCEELSLFLGDFEYRLSVGDLLYEGLETKARSVEMLIVDSLWCIDQLDRYHQQEYLYKISILLRRISWKYNISIIVCINCNQKAGKQSKKSEKKELEGKKDKNTFEKWNSNCYVQIVLNYKTINYKINYVNKEQEDKPLVYRIIQINSGTSNIKYKFVINDEQILLEDI